MNNTYEQVMEELEDLRRKHIGKSRSTLDKIWVLLTNQELQIYALTEALNESQRENDIHTEALSLMKDYEQKAIERTAEKIREDLTEVINARAPWDDPNVHFGIDNVECCEIIDEICNKAKISIAGAI